VHLPRHDAAAARTRRRGIERRARVREAGDDLEAAVAVEVGDRETA
jgi:hypothetical protein